MKKLWEFSRWRRPCQDIFYDVNIDVASSMMFIATWRSLHTKLGKFDAIEHHIIQVFQAVPGATPIHTSPLFNELAQSNVRDHGGGDNRRPAGRASFVVQEPLCDDRLFKRVAT